MTDHLFTTALYIFSSLVQADAAILSLGAIFIIYRLQSFEGAYQNAFLALNSESLKNSASSFLRLATTSSYPEKAAILLDSFESFYRNFVITIAYTADWKKKLIKTSIAPLFMLAIHISLSSIFLLRISTFIPSNTAEIRGLMIVDVVTFVALIFFITSTVRRLITSEDPNPEAVYLNIDRSLPLDPKTLVALATSLTNRSMYRMKIQNDSFYLIVTPMHQNLFGINFLLHDEKYGRILSQKSFVNRSPELLTELWTDFLKNPDSYLRPKK